LRHHHFSKQEEAMQLPSYVKSGEVARLFPVIADSRKEQRATSVLLAVMSAVPIFADAVISSMGRRVGARSIVNTFTEVVLSAGEKADHDRPDGLIEIRSGKTTWRALIEAKIKSAHLEQDQVERYLQLARQNSIDAVVTISNQFAMLPDHHPLPVSRKLTKNVGLFHLSWTAILTEAVLLHEEAAVQDPEQSYMLRELIRFLSHESVGVDGYTSMPTPWKDVVGMVQAGARLNPGDPALGDLVGGWHQKMRDLALMLSRALGEKVSVKLSKLSKPNLIEQEAHIKRDISSLCRDNRLVAVLRVPNAADDLKVVADLKGRTIRTSMFLEAPREKKRSATRLNWLLRQLKDADSTDIRINLVWPSRAADTSYTLNALREDPTQINTAGSMLPPRGFEVILTLDAGRRFVGRKTFIEDIEKTVPDFYARVGQHLRAWQPSPPKPKVASKQQTAASISSEGAGAATKPALGNDYKLLLEIPTFLQRTATPSDE
jgi:hypothetical protein